MEQVQDFDPYFHHPFTMIISGSSGCGKSTLAKQILLNKDLLIYPRVERVLYVYGIYDQSYEDLKTTIPDIIFNEGLATLELDKYIGSPIPTLLIIDDEHQFAVKDPRIQNLFYRSSSHGNLSVILMLHNFFDKMARPLTLNCKHLVIFKNARDQQSIGKLNAQMFPYRKNILGDIMKDQKTPYAYLVINFTPSAEYRIRNSLLPCEECTLYET